MLFTEKKFDVQNPVIGDLLKEINKGKLSEEEYFKKTKTAPDIKDLDIKERFDRVFERKKKKKENFLDRKDDDDDDDDSPPGSRTVPPPPPMDFLDFDFDENINPYNVDLNNLEREYQDRDIPIEDERRKTIQLDTNLREIFPDTDETLYENEASKRRQQFFSLSC